MRDLQVVLDWEVLAAHHPVSLEPFAAELLGCPLGSVGPFHCDAVVVDVFRSVVERIARDRHEHCLLWVEYTSGGFHSKASGVGSLERVADAMTTGVYDLKIIKLFHRSNLHLQITFT